MKRSLALEHNAVCPKCGIDEVTNRAPGVNENSEWATVNIRAVSQFGFAKPPGTYFDCLVCGHQWVKPFE